MKYGSTSQHVNTNKPENRAVIVAFWNFCPSHSMYMNAPAVAGRQAGRRLPHQTNERRTGLSEVSKTASEQDNKLAAVLPPPRRRGLTA